MFNSYVKGKSEALEFKASFGKDVIETLCAFANHRGGTVLIGVANGGKVIGSSFGKESIELTGEIQRREIFEYPPAALRELLLKLIAEAFYLTRDIEKYGTGYIRMRQEIAEYPTMKEGVLERIGGNRSGYWQLNRKALI